MNKNSFSIQLTRLMLVQLFGNIGSIVLMAFAILLGDSAWANPTITRTSGNVFYVETNDTPYMRGNYIAYKIQNDGVARSNVWVKLDMPIYSASGSITLAEFEDGLVQLGAMAPNEAKTAFFYVHSGVPSLSQGAFQSYTTPHNVVVYAGNPNQSGSQITTTPFSFAGIQETLTTGTNTVSTIVTGPTPPELGGIVTVAITSADTGNVNNDSFYLSPATFANWPADKFELFETSVSLGTSPAIQNTLFFTASNKGIYTTIFKFRAVGTTGGATPVSPAIQIGSGQQVKHTNVSGYTTNTSIQPIGTVDSKLKLEKLVSQSQLAAGGTVTYTLRLNNSGSQAAIVQDFMDTLPTGVTVVPSTPSTPTSRFNGVAIADPTGSGQTKTWAGTFSIPAGTSRDLTFQATIPNIEGTYINSAIAHIGNVQIDSTLDTSNDAPATANVQVTPLRISGTVFEDVNYGGGAGRDLAVSQTTAVTSGFAAIDKTSSTENNIGIDGARVELYDSNGTTLLGSTTTDQDGAYKFDNINITGGIQASTTYKVRIVNNSTNRLSSNRTKSGSISPISVQTFRTHSATGIATAVTAEVGGANLLANDDAANSTLTNALSVSTIQTTTAGVANIDFGFNFDTIVNTNDSDQGSLRQFMLNSNALNNTGLTGGREVSIFMIPGQAGLSVGTLTTIATAGIRVGVANQLTNGVAIIKATTPLPQITDTNTSIDGSTQTINVADTNTGTLGYAGLVGTQATSLAAIDKPEVEIQGSSGGVLDIRGENTIVRGVAIRGSANNTSPTGIYIQSGANNFLVENSIIGSGANTFADPGASNRLSEAVVSLGTNNNNNLIVRNNLVGYVGSFGVRSGSSNLLVERNRFAEVGRESWLSIPSSRSEQMRYYGNGPATIKDNYFDSTVVGQIDLGGGQNVLVDNNTLTNGHSVNSNDSYENGAIHARSGASNIIISRNIISNTQNNAHGVMVHSNGYGIAASRVKITQNSIFNSGKLGINLNPAGQVPTNTDDGVTPNDGLTDPLSGNDGMDYPFITSSKLTSNTLTLKGYVGTNNPVTRTKFAAATVEFFVGATNTNDLGPVFSTDPASVAKIHAEGQTYLGQCTTDATGWFGTVAQPCAFNVPTGTNPLNITATATDPAGNTSEFSAQLGNNPQLVLVKRVTKMGSTAISTTIDDTRTTTTATNDNQLKWPLANTANGISPILIGSIDTAKVSPGEEIEYTIYFLSAGDAPIKSINICDLIPANTNYVTGSGQISFNGASPGALASEYLPAGAISNTAGIGLCKTPGNPSINSLTAAENPRGLVWVKIDDYQTALAPFDYGYIRFRALVNSTNP